MVRYKKCNSFSLVKDDDFHSIIFQRGRAKNHQPVRMVRYKKCNSFSLVKDDDFHSIIFQRGRAKNHQPDMFKVQTLKRLRQKRFRNFPSLPLIPFGVSTARSTKSSKTINWSGSAELTPIRFGNFGE